MKKLNPYLNFAPGKSREALNFYKEALNGEIVTIQTFADAKMDVPEPFKNDVLHAVFKAEGVEFMVSSGRPGDPVKPGNNTHLCIDFTDKAEQAQVFKALSTGGKITMPLEDMFWGATFGMIIDRFGISWMLNCQNPK